MMIDKYGIRFAFFRSVARNDNIAQRYVLKLSTGRSNGNSTFAVINCACYSQYQEAAFGGRTHKQPRITMTPTLSLRTLVSILCWLALLSLAALAQTNVQTKPGRDPKQPIDEEYTQKIREYTTAPYFNSPLTDYLPASKNVPTPKAVLGDVAGAPGKLPYSHEVYRYMRMLEQASPRVKVFSVGTTEEGREMIAVAVTSEANMAKLDENRARLAKLADPRTINLDDAEAEKLVEAST